MHPSPPPPCPRCQLTFSATNVSAKGVLLLAVDAAKANDLELSQLVKPECLANAVYAGEIFALQVSLSNATASADTTRLSH